MNDVLLERLIAIEPCDFDTAGLESSDFIRIWTIPNLITADLLTERVLDVIDVVKSRGAKRGEDYRIICTKCDGAAGLLDAQIMYVFFKSSFMGADEVKMIVNEGKK